ncbi:MAG: DUF2612 domain-containing protein [Deferribacteraceae bacterium]|jgi:hypothetical protein|nr:DUF2612 domain-containing protein [Deferribacteraceae bacterium]
MGNDFIKEYLAMLILQYSDMPKAKGEMTAIIGNFSKIYSLYENFRSEFDLDAATGKQLDLIGKIIGLQRNVPYAIAKRFFGFSEYEKSGAFADKNDSFLAVYPFADKFSPKYTNFQMDDYTYRLFIKLKIAKNISSVYMISGERTGIQEAALNAFGAAAYVIDNLNMTLTIYINNKIAELIEYIVSLDLLPRPQGVSYKYVIIADIGYTLGFSDNQYSLGFSDKFNMGVKGGKFAKKLQRGAE